VVERVVRHQPGDGQELAVEDPRLRGTQSIRFEQLEDGVGLTLALDYQLKQSGPLTPVVDLVFIRRALRDSLRRTLRRFSHELASELELLR
jgi:hypothetical protein